jgi:hypothetical protein
MLLVGGKEVLCSTISTAWTKNIVDGGLEWKVVMSTLGHTKLRFLLSECSGVVVVTRNTADWLVAAVDAGMGEAAVPQHPVQAAPQTGNTFSRFFSSDLVSHRSSAIELWSLHSRWGGRHIALTTQHADISTDTRQHVPTP